MLNVICLRNAYRLIIGRVISALLLFLAFASSGYGQISFEKEPINYLTATSNDRVAKLIKAIEDGSVTLKADKKNGYLRAVLKELGVPLSSQVLVFSKTSLQLRYISPQSPRSIYFNDDIYIGWCQGGDVVEVSAVDPDLGAFFYTIDQHNTDKPKFTRQTYECLQCHATSLTAGVPGHTVRSVHTAGTGALDRTGKTYITDHTSPFKQRWGGWYVSGKHGEQRHMGNLPRRPNAYHGSSDYGANVTELGRFFNTAPYLTRHSDIVALMVLEHQSQMHNLLTRASYQTRIAAHVLQKVTPDGEEPSKDAKAAFQLQVKGAAEPLVQYMLMSKEVELTSPVVGTSKFTSEFARQGPRDEQGRSLRDFDLKRRMFKYPCSYLIYSDAFDHLPDAVRDYSYRRLLEVLTSQDTEDDWKHLSKNDRRAILEILCATKQGLPPEFAKALSGE